MIIELPFPDPLLSPNRNQGRTWRLTNQARQDARDVGDLSALEALQDQTLEPAEHYAIIIIFHPPDNRHRDVDNLHAAMKHYLDGICIRLKINDRQFKFTSLSFGENRQRGATTVEIKPINPILELPLKELTWQKK